MSKISVIVPVYNGKDYLEKCLNSILMQDIEEMQVIIINDGSTDNTEEIIDRFVEKYPNVFEKINKQNGGQATARNCGLNKAEGEYVIFLDSDDYIEPEMLTIMYKAAQENQSDIVICDYYEIYEDKKLETRAMLQYSRDMCINYMLSNASPWNKMIKTELMKDNKIKFLEHHIYEDLATMPILGGYAKKITYINKPLYNYVIRNGSTMRQNIYNKKLESIFVAIDHLENEMKKRGLYDKYKEEIEFLNIYHLLYAASGRFLEYKEGMDKLREISKIIKNKYPTWEKNKYYKKQNLKIKITSKMFYKHKGIKTYCFLKKIIKK